MFCSFPHRLETRNSWLTARKLHFCLLATVANQKPEAVADQKPETQPVNVVAPRPPEDVTPNSVQAAEPVVIARDSNPGDAGDEKIAVGRIAPSGSGRESEANRSGAESAAPASDNPLESAQETQDASDRARTAEGSSMQGGEGVILGPSKGVALGPSKGLALGPSSPSSGSGDRRPAALWSWVACDTCAKWRRLPR